MVRSTEPIADVDRRDLVPAGLVAASSAWLEEIRRVADEFAVAITADMAALIDPADAADPIAAQFVPSAAELVAAPEERADPIGDERWSPVPGIVHRYPDRVLLKPTLLCPVYCRFCFRREVVGKRAAMLDPPALERAFGYIRERPEIWEVIVTGGDPFLLAPRRIAEIVRTLDQIPHLGVIRFHTRVPVVDPRRVTAALVEALAAEKAVYVVIHANHPRELTPQAGALSAPQPRRDPAAVADGPAARRQRRRGGAGGVVPRPRRDAGQALLPPPCRSRARHGALSHRHRGRPAPRARAARPSLRAVPADLCSRHSRRLRQGADRPLCSEPEELIRGVGNRRPCRHRARLSA